jgi:hypothetical protein
VPTAETSSLARTAHKPAYKRLTDDQRVAILQLAKVGKSQVEIAETLGCDQSTVSRWLQSCQDTTSQATAYLRGQALRMSRNIVEKGRAADHIKALEGISVLAPEQKLGITVQIGIKADRVKLITPTFACSTQQLSEDIHTLSVETGSDNSRLC